MRNMFCVLASCMCIALATDLPIYISADSISAKKFFLSDSIQQYEIETVCKTTISYMETVLFAESTLVDDRIIYADPETMRIVCSAAETVSFTWHDIQIMLYGTSKNLKTLLIPQLGDFGIVASLLKGETYSSNFVNTYSETTCIYTGTRKVFENIYLDTLEGNVFIRKNRYYILPEDDSCSCQQENRQHKNLYEIIIKRYVKDNDSKKIDSKLVNSEINIESIANQFSNAEDRYFPVIHFPANIKVPSAETLRVPIGCIDKTWRVRYKWLYERAREYDTYSGYITYFDEIPWTEISYRDIGDTYASMAAPALYQPVYAGEVIGQISDIIDSIEMDGLINDSVYAAIEHGEPGFRKLRDIFHKNFDSTSTECPIVFSRPVDTLFFADGNLCDNFQQCQFSRQCFECDTVGMIGTGRSFSRTYAADLLHFSGTIDLRKLASERILPVGYDETSISSLRLILYAIAAGSVTRIWINNSEYHLPSEFPDYGVPYETIENGAKFIIENPNLRFDIPNKIVVEVVAPRPECIGAQVIFVLESIHLQDVMPIEMHSTENALVLNKPTLYAIESCAVGFSADTIAIAGLDNSSAVFAWWCNNGMWQPANFHIVDSSLIVNFGAPLAANCRWRWWFFDAPVPQW